MSVGVDDDGEAEDEDGDEEEEEEEEVPRVRLPGGLTSAFVARDEEGADRRDRTGPELKVRY